MDVLYILAADPVDGTAYAAQVLGIPLRAQQAKAVLITERAHLPARFEVDDEVRATPKVWDNRTQTVGILWSAILQRKGKISPPFDYPMSMGADELNAWLDS